MRSRYKRTRQLAIVSPHLAPASVASKLFTKECLKDVVLVAG